MYLEEEGTPRIVEIGDNGLGLNFGYKRASQPLYGLVDSGSPCFSNQ